MPNWYYADGTETRGPVDEDEIRAMARRGALTSTTYVVPEGDTTWVLLCDVETRLGLKRDASGGYGTRPAGMPEPRPENEPPAGTAGAGPLAGVQPAAPVDSGTAGDRPAWVAGSAEAGPLAGVQPVGPVDTGPPGYGTGTGSDAPAMGGWAGPAEQPWRGPAEQPWPATWGPSGPGAPPWGAPPAPPAWAAGQVPAAYGAYGGATLASWPQRVLAKLIDWLILLVPTLAITLPFAWGDLKQQLDAAGSGSSNFNFAVGTTTTLTAIAAGLVAWAYYAFFNGRGQTPGKRVLGIKVVRLSDGAPIGTPKGILRHLVQFLTNIPVVACIAVPFVLVDSLWPLWDAQNQALHDKFVGSVVIRVR